MTDELTKGERTRKKLVDTTASLLRCQGYHATGLSQIVAASGAPRGSLYFHFPGGKDDLAIAALEASGEAWRARLHDVIAGTHDLAGALEAIIGMLADDLERSDWDNGCPVATVALESTAPAVRQSIARHFEHLTGFIVELLTGYGVAEPAAREVALVGLSGLEGALLLSRVMRSRAPLLAIGRALQAMLAPAAPAPRKKR